MPGSRSHALDMYKKSLAKVISSKNYVKSFGTNSELKILFHALRSSYHQFHG